MTVAEFKKKWARYQGKESAAYQEHFIDLCHILGQPTPVEADPSGNDFFCFQKRVVKGAEFLNLEHPDCGDPTEHGFADVWKKDCFGWEYKGKKEDLSEAYRQRGAIEETKPLEHSECDAPLKESQSLSPRSERQGDMGVLLPWLPASKTPATLPLASTSLSPKHGYPL